MVNQKDMQILSLLSSSRHAISGDTIGKELGLSRVAVWKHIRSMKEQGIPLVSTPKGYLFKEKTLDASQLALKRLKLLYVYAASSTMELAEGCIKKREEYLCIAEHQTEGRGRKGRPWESDGGGIYATFLLYDPIPLKTAYRHLIAGALAAIGVLAKEGIEARFKWPNDILVGEQKIGGVLVETKGELDACEYIKLGIGININNQSLPPNGTSAFVVLDRELEREKVIVDLEELFLSYRKILLDDGLIEELKRHCCTLGKRVRIETYNKTITGVAKDIDSEGNLLVDCNKKIEHITYGDCFHLR